LITIPDDATPADVVGDTNVLAGQDWLDRAKLVEFANQMASGQFNWESSQRRDPMSMQEGSNGRVINQGHHRWVAARLAGIEIPITIKIMRNYWPGPVVFAIEWQTVV
jgi:hypothetical protein